MKTGTKVHKQQHRKRIVPFSIIHLKQMKLREQELLKKTIKLKVSNGKVIFVFSIGTDVKNFINGIVDSTDKYNQIKWSN